MTSYRNTSKQYGYSPATAITASWLSEYMKGRQYKYSVYQQLLNTLALQFDKLNTSLLRHQVNRFPQTYLHDTLDVVYTVDKPATYNSVKYFDGAQWQLLPMSSASNIHDWWYETIPTGINEISRKTMSAVIIDHAHLQPYMTPAINTLTYPSGLYIILEGANASFIRNIYNEPIEGITITIHGFDDFDHEQKEEFIFFNSGVFYSPIKWKHITSITTSGWDDGDKFNVTIANYIPSSYTQREDMLYVIPETNRQIKSPIWDFTANKLVLKTLVANSTEDFHAGVRDIEIYKEYVLFSDPNTELNIIDSILPSNTDNKLYVLSEGYLLCYNKTEGFSKLTGKATNLKTPDPVVSLDVQIETGKLTITGEYNHLYANKFIDQYKFSIIKSNGEQLDWDGNNWVTNGNFINNEIKDAYGFMSPEIIYTETDYIAEDLIVKLDIILTNKSHSVDTFIVDAQTKKPLFALALPYAPSGASLCFSSDGFITIATPTEQSFIEFRVDEYLLDSSKDQLIFKENYQLIRFDDDSTTDTVPQPFNVFTSIDQYAAMQHLARPLGTKTYTFYNTLRDSFYNRDNSTYKGILHALARSLSLKVEDGISLIHNDPFTIRVSSPKIYVTINGINHEFNMFKYTADTINNSILDVVNWLTGLGFTVTNISDQLDTLPARAMVNYNNVTHIYNKKIRGTSRIEIQLPENYVLDISSIQLDGFNYVPDEEALIASTSPAFTISGANIIVLNRMLSGEKEINYDLINTQPILPVCPIIISDIYPIVEDLSTPDEVSAYVKALMAESEHQHPLTWRN